MIITDLFDKSPLREMDTLDKVKEGLTNIPIQVCPNYIAHILDSGSDHLPRTINLDKHLEFLQTEPRSLDSCSEYPTPQELIDLLPINFYQDLSDRSDIYSNMFVAGSHNYAHLHYDADQRDVLLFQLFPVPSVDVQSLSLLLRDEKKVDITSVRMVRKTRNRK